MEDLRLSQTIKPNNLHIVDCYSSKGFLKWTEAIPNMVTEEGAIWLLDTAFGPGEQQDWFCGLVESGQIANDDTMFHHNWVEFTGTTHQYRPGLTFTDHNPKTAATTYSTEKSAQFVIHEAGKVTGSFMTTDDSIGGSIGLLYGVTLFQEIHKVVQGDSIYITIILGSKV